MLSLVRMSMQRISCNRDQQEEEEEEEVEGGPRRPPGYCARSRIFMK